MNLFRILLSFLLTFSLFSCRKMNGLPEKEAGSKEIIPVTLEPSTTLLYLSDFVDEVDLIDSVNVPAGFQATYRKDSATLQLKAMTKKLPFQSVLRIWLKETYVDVLLRKSQKQTVEFNFDPNGKQYKKVSIMGEMNNWNKETTSLSYNGNTWNTTLMLNPGTYQYKIVADGKLFNDPSNKDSASNGIGSYNSLLTIGDENGKRPYLFAKEYNNKTVEIGFTDGPTKFFVFWNNYLLDKKFVSVSGEKIKIKIPGNAANKAHSTLRIFSHNRFGESNDVKIHLRFKEPLLKETQAVNDLPETMVIYFLLVDRFFNGDASNDKPVADKNVHAKSNYQGGDLQGVIQKIQSHYFDSLGFNTIWVSPIFQNPDIAYTEYPAPHRKFSGYHGYWPISLTKVDYRFGSNEVFKKLVETAHKNGSRIIMDYVANHVHQDHPVVKKHPDWIVPLKLDDGRNNIRLWDEHRLTTWFDTFLPDLDFSKNEVIESMTDTAVFWAENFNIDGFRHDATKHVHEAYWRRLTQKLRTVQQRQKKELYQVGETFGSRELIKSYIGSGQMDGQFDFNLYFDARSVWLNENESFEKLEKSLHSTLAYYGHHHRMANITGNHDLPRFISLASGAMSQNEDDKEAGWSRKIEVKDTMGYLKLMQLQTFMFTIPGIPVLYYGDEIGMPGAGDPDNRRMMQFSKLNAWQTRVKQTTQKLAMIRRSSPEMLFGETRTEFLDKDVWAYSRTYFNRYSVVCMNKSNQTKEITINAPTHFRNKLHSVLFGNKVTRVKNTLIIKLPPYSSEIVSFF